MYVNQVCLHSGSVIMWFKILGFSGCPYACPIWAQELAPPWQHTACVPPASNTTVKVRENMMKHNAYSCINTKFRTIWDVCTQVTTVIICAKSCLRMRFLPKSGTGFHWVRTHSHWNFVLFWEWESHSTICRHPDSGCSSEWVKLMTIYSTAQPIKTHRKLGEIFL